MGENFEYLLPDFDPSTLTVARLRGIFVEHDVTYPSGAKKPELVEIFNDKIAPQAKKILKVRSKADRSSRGIIDVPSSQEESVNGDDNNATPASAQMLPPPVPATPKRKVGRPSTKHLNGDASTATPATEGKSSVRKSSTKRASSRARASDVETSTDDAAKPASTRRRKKSSATPIVKFEDPSDPLGRKSLSGEDSPFSSDNVFQRGTSPTEEKKRKRKSSGLVPTLPDSEEKLASSTRRRSKKDEKSPSTTSKKYELSVASLKKEGSAPGEEFTPEAQLELEEEGDRALVRRRKPTRQGSSSSAIYGMWIIAITLVAGYGAWWRQEKLALGYCGLGKETSAAFEDPRIPDWLRIIEPKCEPCPQHAYCYQDLKTECERDFVLKAHPYSLNGLVPLAPSCEADGEKVRRVKAVADKAIEELRERRAKFECGELKDEAGKESPVVEMDEEQLKTTVASKRRKGMSDAEFNDLWGGAIGEIIGRDEVVSNIDGRNSSSSSSSSRGRLLSSTSLARLSLACAVRRSVRGALARNRGALSLIIGVLLSALYIRYKLRQRFSISARVPALVGLALDQLAMQSALYQRNNAIEPWLSVGQLRDDVLRDEFSFDRRDSVWKKVQAVVERNSNVRSSVVEMKSGEVSRVWEWIGVVRSVEELRALQDRGATGWSPGDRVSPKNENSGMW